jgi:outer membrane receptor protein involved in Fe transport
MNRQKLFIEGIKVETTLSPLSRLLLTTALVAPMATFASAALAQTTPTDDILSEVVVTATKQADTVSRVPLSITAVSEQNLVEQGVKNAQDLSRVVPALTVTTSNTGNGATVAIRGIASTVGAQTTGVYLDDTPLQRRNGLGGVVGNGTIFPQIFDLERIEVLRGPQGTLYGGSSQGGTIRFITPQPSLTRFSGQARLELATTKNGDLTYEGGVAAGGPIVEDKLGFRASVWSKRVGGYLDHVSRLTGKTLAENTNSEDAFASRLAMTWAPTERLRITPAVYYSRNKFNDSDQFWEDVPQFTVAARTTAGYTHPAFTYGPYNFYGPYKTGDNCWIGDQFVNQVQDCSREPTRTSELLLPSLTLDYSFPTMDVKSVTSYIEDLNRGWSDFTYNELNSLQGGAQFVADLPFYQSTFLYQNKRTGITEELRFSSNAPESRLSWVGGLFFSNIRTNSFAWLVQPLLGEATRVILNQTVQQRYGAPLMPGGIGQIRDQNFTETEVAGFGEATFKVTDKLKLLAGVRVSRAEIKYRQLNYGAQNGFLDPTLTNGGLADGSQTESPVTPKAGISYQIDPGKMIYVNASKGFRIGGVNLPPPVPRCTSDLQALGIASTPGTYESDTVWNYEAGAKLRLFNKVQLNSSVFRIDWKNVQVNYNLPTCNHSYVVNSGSARSQGFDVQAQAKVVGGLSVSAQVGYTDAKYTSALTSPAPASALLILKGDRLPTPKWSLNLGAQYDFAFAGRYDAYVRADYQYASSYASTFGPGTSSYRPDQYIFPSADFVTMRAGVRMDRIELSVFANNLFNSTDVLSRTGGRSGCNNAACTAPRTVVPVYFDTTYRPRTIGATLQYRF